MQMCGKRYFDHLELLWTLLRSFQGRATINGETYYRKLYDRAKVINSYTIEYCSDDEYKFGYIEYFVSLETQTVIVITPLTTTEEFCYPRYLRALHRHIIPICVESSLSVINSPSSLVHKYVSISLSNATYLARQPNHVYIH